MTLKVIVTDRAKTDNVTEALRARMGIQCPECYGVGITARQTRFDPSPTGWQCEECGCQWSTPITHK